MGRRRTAVLIAIHLLIFAHLLHWRLAGTTLSPLEPSEAMATVAEGIINAGAILLAISVVATLVLGRFFCGWACHLVALQDLCGWLMKKVGIRPRPLRSRWLVFVPLLAGLYMFFFPALVRAVEGTPGPTYRLELTEQAFWETFPGFWIGALTFLVCGFAIVYVVGSKGFCTYACPYGGLFGVADRLAPGRIRVSDACKGCGHCSAACTSNVLVHQEVRDFGMVVDPGCMKCLDCVSTCPTKALRFGFGRPAFLARSKRSARPARRPWTFSWREDVALTLAFAVVLLILRGVPRGIERVLPFLPEDIGHHADRLYDQVPLLFALGLAAISAFALLLGWRLTQRRRVRINDLLLRDERGLRPAGRWAALVVVALVLFLAHSAWVQYHMFRGRQLLAPTARIDEAAAWAQDPRVVGQLPPALARAAASSAHHLRRAREIGLFGDVRISRDLAWIALIEGDLERAERHLRGARDLRPEDPMAHVHLARVALRRGEPGDAFAHIRRGFAEDPARPELRVELGQALELFARSGRLEEGLEAATSILADHPGMRDLRRWRALILMELGRGEAGRSELRRLATETDPNPTDLFLYGRALLDGGAPAAEAVPTLRAAVDARPADFYPRLYLAWALLDSGAPDAALAHALEALQRLPPDVEVARLLLSLLERLERPEAQSLRQRIAELGRGRAGAAPDRQR
jgi:tetratricopeptide (TPR) repeat protein/ferredoxin